MAKPSSSSAATSSASGGASSGEDAVDVSHLSYREALGKMRTAAVRAYLEAVLRRFEGNVAAAAAHADLERESFYRLCRRHGLSPTDYRAGANKTHP